MRNAFLAALALFMLAPLGFSQPKPRTFTGQIMDEPCAKNGNHDAGYRMTGTHTPKDCTLACANSGAKIVLYIAADKTFYLLDNQAKARAFAGENVKVTATYDAKTRTIHVESIAAVH
jgi:hypothetical protein